MVRHQHTEARSALVIGGGPAGLLCALTLVGRGFRVSVCDPRLHRPMGRPQAQHVHVVKASTWRKLCALAPDLPQELVRLGARCGHGDGDSLDATGSRPRRLFPDRWMIDAALEALCARHSEITLLPTKVCHLTRRPDGWHAAPLLDRRFDWLVDCTGTARESLRSLDVEQRPGVLESRVGGGHASVRLTGVRWPAGIVGHAARDADGLGGFLLRRCSRTETLITLQLPGQTAGPRGAGELLDAVRRCPDGRLSALVRGALPVGPVHRWRNRRMSVLDLPPGTPCQWLAVGDALLTTPPRLGEGFSQLVRQVEILAQDLADERPCEGVLERLFTKAREQFYGASMAQLLWETCPPEPVAAMAAEVGG